MFTYYQNRGLDCVNIIAKNLHNRTWWLPDLLCPDVISAIKDVVKNIEYYHIDESTLDWAPRILGNDLKVFYAVDYFGKETRLDGNTPRNTIIVRDSVWFPFPFTPVRGYEIWFNSLRKIFHADRLSKGAFMISPFKFHGLESVPNIANHSSLTWWEMNKRWENYNICLELFNHHMVRTHYQDFPSVFPIILNNRDEVLEKLGTPLPGMWEDWHNLGNVLYDRLAFIPLDSRFNRQRLSDLAARINELAA